MEIGDGRISLSLCGKGSPQQVNEIIQRVSNFSREIGCPVETPTRWTFEAKGDLALIVTE
jgi:hypothetical protein